MTDTYPFCSLFLGSSLFSISLSLSSFSLYLSISHHILSSDLLTNSHFAQAELFTLIDQLRADRSRDSSRSSKPMDVNVFMQMSTEEFADQLMLRVRCAFFLSLFISSLSHCFSLSCSFGLPLDFWLLFVD